MIDKDGIKTLRNIETDFNEIARSDQRADLLILRQYSYELITSKIFKAVMMTAIVLNTILMVLPMMLSNNDLLADNSRVFLSILENIIGKLFVFEIINGFISSEGVKSIIRLTYYHEIESEKLPSLAVFT